MRAGKRRIHEDLVSIPFPARDERPSHGDRWKFTQREPDADTALRDYRARSYDPAPARWTHQDPVGFAAGDANLYRYADDGPTEVEDGPGPCPS